MLITTLIMFVFKIAAYCCMVRTILVPRIDYSLLRWCQSLDRCVEIAKFSDYGIGNFWEAGIIHKINFPWKRFITIFLYFSNVTGTFNNEKYQVLSVWSYKSGRFLMSHMWQLLTRHTMWKNALIEETTVRSVICSRCIPIPCLQSHPNFEL